MRALRFPAPAFFRWNSRPSLILAAALLAGLFTGPAPAPAVVINEINYNPVNGSELEFIELFNPSAAPVSMEGWRFTEGLRFTFPASASIPARGFAVVARNREVLSLAYDIPLGRLLGDLDGGLDNGGERLVLVDARGTVIDEIHYDDSQPWPIAADGHGGSLERVCIEVDAQNPANWASDPDAGATPLRTNNRTVCPLPPQAVPELVFNEIQYHPLNDKDEVEEFVELYNTTARTIDLKGYSFSQGFGFTFEAETLIPPGGYLAVARNAENLRGAFGIDNVAGDFTGQLSNDGERLTLVDPSGNLVDSVRYRDSGDWPVAADGLGRSLEKLVPTAPSDDPASWQPSGIGDLTVWKTAISTGIAISSRFYLYIGGEGEFLIDDISVTTADDPQTNLIVNGGFDANLDGWAVNGNHDGSTWEPEDDPAAGGRLHLISTGLGSGSRNGLTLEVDPPLLRDGTIYRLSMRYKYISGETGLVMRNAGGSLARGMFIDIKNRPISTPGAANSVLRAALPPFISGLGRFPQEPSSADPTWISARVRGNAIRGVYLKYRINSEPTDDVIELLDDGSSSDADAGDGVYGGAVPPLPHNTIVTFRILAEDAAGAVTEYPAEGDPTGSIGFYVNDDQPESKLPVYHLLFNHTSPTPARSLMSSLLNCGSYMSASFAFRGDLYHNVGLRKRGQSVCGATKPYLKVRFNRGREFEGKKNINLQSLWSDKALVREHLAWEFFHEMDYPYCTTQHVRLHANGKYYGLHSELERPDSRFLERNGLNPSGNLYKAVASREERMTNYQAGYEKKTNENGDFSDLTDFLNTMHTTPIAQLQTFFQDRTFEDALVDYQASQIIPNNRDYPHKNHYLYHDTEAGRWMPLTWDMDLTFGKRWDGSFSGVYNDLMDNPGISPWYTTQVDGGGTGNHLLDKFFFNVPGKYYQRALLVRVWDALQEKYTTDIYNAKLARLQDLLMEEQAEDIRTWGRTPASGNDPSAPADFLSNLERIRTHITSRRAYLINYLRSRERFNGHDRLKITEIHYNPEGPSEDGEFLELWNNSGREIDAAGWSIEGIGFTFPDPSLIADGEVFAVVKNPEVFHSIHGDGVRTFGPYPGNLDNSGEELRIKDAGPGFPATVDLVRYSDNNPWPAGADGLGFSIELTDVSPDRDNDYPEAWRVSTAAGGTPGRLPGEEPPVPFRRGDCNGDGAVNISDAVRLVGVLFRGAGAPSCGAACDADGDLALDITDVVYLLSFLFLEGDPIPAPGPRDCGTAPRSACEASPCAAPGA